LILALKKAVMDDPEKPILDQKFNPTDPIAVALVLYEVDFAVDKYMEKFASWREKFVDPSAYDNFVQTYQQKARKDVKRIISEAQQLIAEEMEEEEGDDDGGV
jgi:hypothetical protein